MNIATFIREHRESILDEWEAFARALPIANALTKAALRDHAEGILQAIATDLEHEQTPAQQTQKATGHGPAMIGASQAARHGTDRVLEGFSVNDTMSEYRALRASVMRLWTDEAATLTTAHDDLIRFNEAIDQALTESLAGYSGDRERRSRLYEAMLSASPDLSFIVDTDTRLIYGNAAMAEEFAEPVSALRGKRFSDTEGTLAEQFESDVRRVANSRCTALGEISRTRRGQIVTYEYVLVPVISDTGEVEAVAGTARNVTDRKAAEEKYKRGAQYDDLTGLPNRYLFRDRLDHEMRRADRIKLPLALMFIDLDGFKQVNDLMGHEAGDELLRQGAARIGQCVRDTDTVARLGGDEFTVILTEIRHMPHVHILAQHILDELAREFTITGRNVLVSASVGIALYPHDAAGAAELLRHADQAMYSAKQTGRNRYCFFTPEMRHAAWLHRQRVDELRQGIAAQQLRVLYQPIVALDDNAVVGAEAQLYWQHPQRGPLRANAFADLAEEAGLAVQMGQLVLQEAIARADEWRLLRGAPFYVCIDKSSLALSANAANQQCRSIIDALAQAHSPVALEVTEALVLGESPASIQMLKQMSSSGVSLCLADFGSGNAALGSLSKFALTGVRIAPQLVHAVMEPTPRSLAVGLIATSHALNLKVIAEGVENSEQAAQLREIGCDYAQGAHFFGALDRAAVRALLSPGPP
jgi:diguanylate cyclase (GGDEF)-like protein/PAS domain S-box-containing protein